MVYYEKFHSKDLKGPFMALFEAKVESGKKESKVEVLVLAIMNRVGQPVRVL